MANERAGIEGKCSRCGARLHAEAGLCHACAADWRRCARCGAPVPRNVVSIDPAAPCAACPAPTLPGVA